jgi:hypothetical protein
VLGDLHVPVGDVVVPAEQVFHPGEGGLVALLHQGAVAVDGGDPGDLDLVRPPRHPLSHEQAGEGVRVGVDERERLLDQARGLGERVLGHAPFYSN